MTLSPDLTLVEKALDELERREVRVLVWGLVDSALSEAEVMEVLDYTLDSYYDITSDPECSFLSSRGLLERLLALSLIMPVELGDGRSVRYRSRMAEGVRLLVRLRQLLPKHERNDQWIAAPNLVADYRLLWRPRRYPKRNITSAEAREQLAHRSQGQTFAAVDHWLNQHGAKLKLARFQVDAAARILESLNSGRPGGTLVAAGTGSGKTLAFYLPALSWLAAQKHTNPGRRGVRILAVYPRTELLKDQLREVFSQARRFDDFLGRAGAPPISVGVFYGETPGSLANAWEAWRPQHGACPFFRCPACRQEMRLRPGGASSDASLLCNSCGTVVDGRQLRLTRKEMRVEPPDVLFTTVEMLNQRMSDSEMRHLFGLGPDAESVPALMLLDEVHLYTGTYGAQVAFLLRRWSHLTGRRTSFVGLSATLAEGKHFFASLTGMEEAVVEEISPQTGDMEDEGAEYMLALRGDPVSQTALLSTSIQTLMLGSRLLDPRERFSSTERPFAGWRSFAFTDQMDATNRLFYDLRDAEGRNESGNAAISRHPNGGLAHLREPKPENRKRFEAGQDWRLATRIGHTLSHRHRVERTTSYDGGVDHAAEIVVATAALEVGYDDPAVGLVLQHKAPRDMAQFLQRKGRAGRTRHMRPWTLMVLSDYGRDRLAYQAYEQYFDPQLPPRELPLGNRYVRRMQAVYALINYLGVLMQAGYPTGSAWRDLSGPILAEDFQLWPTSNKSQIDALFRQFQFPLTAALWKHAKAEARKLAPRTDPKPWAGSNRLQGRLRARYLVNVLAAVLRDDEAGERLAIFLQRALDLRREEIDLLLWDHPRPLLLAAVPTALRRLASNWRAGDVPAGERATRHPLPEFVPATLFSDLTLPEVELRLPNADSTYALPVLQGLSEFAPGKVSRRFDHPLWLGPGEAQLIQLLDAANTLGTEASIPVDDWYTLEPQPAFNFADASGVSTCPAFRPVAFHLQSVPDGRGGNAIQVQDSSNARLLWLSQIFGRREGAKLTVPGDRVGIACLFQDVIVHTHASQSQATVRRFAVASSASLRVRRSNERINYRATWRFEKDGHPCGIGFEIEADALCFRLQLPVSPTAELLRVPTTTQRAARTARYRWEAQHGSALAGVEENPFARDWLAQIFQIAAVSYAAEQDVTLFEAIGALGEGKDSQRLGSVLSAIFQSTDVVEGDGTHTAGDTPRLKENLQASLRRVDVVRALAELATRTMTDPFDATWDDWLCSAHLHTLGAAVLEAIQQACPQVSTDDLAVDVDPGPLENGTLRAHTELWVSEVNPGGNGLIEQLVEALVTDPTLFFRRIESALSASEFEIIDAQLRRFVRAIGSQDGDPELIGLTHAIRESDSSRQTQEGLEKLRRALVQRNQAVFHGFMAALSSRILRPHTPPDLDALLADFMLRWEELEARLGVEVDARVTCALLSHDDRIDKVFLTAGFNLPDGDRTTWRFSVLLGLVWARGHVLRNHALPLPLRFQDSPAVSERLLLQNWISKPDTPVAADAADWLETLHDRLIRLGRVTVSIRADPTMLARVMGPLVTCPVQLEYLNVYPKLVSVARQGDEIYLQLKLEAAA